MKKALTLSAIMICLAAGSATAQETRAGIPSPGSMDPGSGPLPDATYSQLPTASVVDAMKARQCLKQVNWMLHESYRGNFAAAAATFSTASSQPATEASVRKMWSDLASGYGERLGTGGRSVSFTGTGADARVLVGVPLKFEKAQLVGNALCDASGAIADFKVTQAAASDLALR